MDDSRKVTSFNPPPHWPEPREKDWKPQAGWMPDPAWPQPPAGWAVQWESDSGAFRSHALSGTEELSATSARPPAGGEYPIEVDLPGHLVRHTSARTEPTHGRVSSRTWTLIAALIGVLAIVATIVAFIWLYNFAHSSLPQTEAAARSVGAMASGGGEDCG